MSDENQSRDSSKDEKLDGIFDEILERQRSGQQLSIEEFVGLYPELEKELRELFPALNIAENLRSTPFSTLHNSEVGLVRLLNRDSQRFQILRSLDRGGLGVVSVALDKELHREVAIKEIREDRADDRGLRNKFILEAEVTGGLEHPGIVPVYALGSSSDGRPYYAMRLIRGNNFRDHIRRFHEQVKSKQIQFNGPQLRQLLRRFLVVCEAVDYAHSRGVLHRDLKPSNVMVGRFGETLVVDWGLAKVTGVPNKSTDEPPANQLGETTVSSDQETPMIRSGTDDATREGAAIGTPGYAPPEQLLGKSESIGVRSDVYSLGAILYELLTNTSPASGSLAEITKQVTNSGIPTCISILPLVPKPIEAICMKAISAEYNDRYASAGLMRSDIEHWLDDEAVSAYAEPLFVRSKRWLKNHQTLASTLLAIGCMTILGSVFVAYTVSQNNAKLILLNTALDQTNSQLVESNHREMLARNEAERREKAERWERYRTSIAATVTSKQVDNRVLMKQSLQSAPEEFRNWEWRHFESQLEELAEVFPGGSEICPKTRLHAIIADGKDVHFYAPNQIHLKKVLKHDSAISFVRFSPDSSQLAVVLQDNRLILWDLQKDITIASSQADSKIAEVMFHPSRPLIFLGLRNERGFARWFYNRQEKIASDPRLGDPMSEHPLRINHLGDRLLSNDSSNSKISLIDGESNEVVFEMNGKALGFSPNGDKFLVFTQDRLQVRSSQTGEVSYETKHLGADATYWKYDWSLDGNRILIGGKYPYLSLLNWDLTTGTVNELQGHNNGIWEVEISQDGKLGLSASQDMTARVWDLTISKELHVLRGHKTPVRTVGFSHDGKRIVTCGDDPTCRVWDSDSGYSIATLKRPYGNRELCFTDDDSAIVCKNDTHIESSFMSSWNTNVLEQNGILRGHSSYIYDVVFSADGSRFASAAWDGTIRLWDAKSFKTTQVFRPPTSNSIGFRSVDISPNGKLLVGAGILGVGGEVFVWDIDSQKLLQQWTCDSDTEDFRASFDCTGRTVLAGTPDGSVRCLDIASGTILNTLNGHGYAKFSSRYPKTCSDVIAHTDQRRWLSAGFDGNILVWNSNSGKQLSKMEGHDGPIYRIRISHNGKFAASAGFDGIVKIWNIDTYQLIATLDHGSPVYAISFSVDDSRLATGAADGLIRLWDLATNSQVAELHGHTDYVHAVDFSPDGTQLLSGSGDQTVRIWDTISPRKRNQ